MLVKFWGTRGSLPKPGLTTVKYGGNTSCVQLISNRGENIIIDCGTGAHDLGKQLISEWRDDSRYHILFSHTHWDHIQGMPFFAPFFDPRRHWDVYGPQRLLQSIHEALEGQMVSHYFPISIDDFGATIRYHGLVEGEFYIGDIKIQTHYLNHTTLTIGYRIETEGIVIVYSCDHEPFSRVLAGGEGEICGQDRSHLEFLKGADLVIHDAQYTPKEYLTKIGWGHSTPEYVIRMCQEAGVKNVALTHHDPFRTDDELDRINDQIQDQLIRENSQLKAFVAYEGKEFELGNQAVNTIIHEFGGQEIATALSGISQSALVGHSVMIYCVNPTHIAVLIEALEREGVAAEVVTNLEAARSRLKQKKTVLAVVEHTPPDFNGIEIAREIHREALANDCRIPILLVASDTVHHSVSGLGDYDWLFAPFTCSYARAKIEAWVLRTSSDRSRDAIYEEERRRMRHLSTPNTNTQSY